MSRKTNEENVKLFYRTDMHSHIMPGVDHGSQSVEESIEMLKAEIDMGINRVILFILFTKYLEHCIVFF